MKNVVLIDGVRTPLGKHGGILRSLTAQHMQAKAFEGLLARVPVDPLEIDEVIVGCVGQDSDAVNMGRVAALTAGLPVSIPAATIHRNCVSGMMSVSMAYQGIQSGDGEVYLCGGTESMSTAPYVVRGARWGLKLRHTDFIDAVWERLTDPVIGQTLSLSADLLVLSTGIVPESQGPLAQVLELDLGDDGFFVEEHAKMKPLDLGRGGLYVAGLAHSPRFLEETIAQAQGAAMRAAAFLAPQVVTDRPTAVWVNERLCSFCGLCVEACPYGARVMNYDSRVADVDYALCQGCGVCAMVCPNKATLQKAFEHKQLLAAIELAV